MQICCVNCPFYLLVLVVTTFVFIFPFLKAAVRAVSLVRPVPLFFSLCFVEWFVVEQIKIDMSISQKRGQHITAYAISASQC